MVKPYDFGLAPWPHKRPGYVFILTDRHGTFATDERGRKVLRISDRRIGEEVNPLANSLIYNSRDSRRGDTRYRATFLSTRRVEVTNLTTGRVRIIPADVFRRRYY